jgi:hypothetical protein
LVLLKLPGVSPALNGALLSFRAVQLALANCCFGSCDTRTVGTPRNTSTEIIEKLNKEIS